MPGSWRTRRGGCPGGGRGSVPVRCLGFRRAGRGESGRTGTVVGRPPEGRDYGYLPVEEGARVSGLHTETSWGGATGVALLCVGRDGRTVTVVERGQMGDFGDAPVAAFKKTTTTAVNKLS
ncbi:putative uncharacterized protein [Streptomyces azureus]|uniref:Uncharacterized protein n=1 Tax=Streptomyces azureus TaxID=146537 RepID=A0A0K8PYB0_STRAJ|nr:putative uncharacterized protein [Streptomyces azureus]